MEKKLLQRDDSELSYGSNDEKLFKAGLEHYSNPDDWHIVYANEIRSFGVSNAPILEDVYRNEENLESVTSEDFMDCISNTGIFTCLPNAEGTRYITYAGRPISTLSMYNRSGTNCRLVNTIVSHGEITAESPEERGEIINRGWQKTKELLHIYIPDGKISFFGSKKYVILPYIDGYDAVTEALKKSFPDYSFIDGKISHEYIIGQWQLNDEEVEDTYSLMLAQHGVLEENEKVTISLRYSTSNVGSAKMSARLLLNIGSIQIPLGESQNIWHHADYKCPDIEKLTNDNGCSIEDFKIKLERIGNILKENEAIIEALGNTPIKHPAGCLEHILENCNTFSASDKDALVEEMDALYPEKNGDPACMAIDVYIMASRLPENGKDIRSIVKMTEEIAQLQFKNFTLYDKERTK